MKCAYDKTRMCNDSCAAFESKRNGVESQPFLDKTDPLRQFNWRRTGHFQGDYCNRGGFFIKNTEMLEVVDDTRMDSR